MALEPIGIVTIAAGMAGIKLGEKATVSIFVFLTLLGSAGAILISSGGTIQPAHFFLIFLFYNFLNKSNQISRTLNVCVFPNAGFWLFATVCYGVISAYFMPRLFAGMTQTNAIGITEYGPSFLLVPLGPTSGNITQSIYLLSDFICFVLIYGFVRNKINLEILVKCILLYGLANIFFGLLDIVTYWTNTSFLLDFIRNAQYDFHLEESSGLLKRIAGSFTETSSFSYATIGSFCFTIKLYLKQLWPKWTGILSISSIFMLLISTSSTALASTLVVVIYIYVESIIASINNSSNKTQNKLLIAIPFGVLFITMIFLLNADLFNLVSAYVDTNLISKASSESGLSRSSWNLTAYQNFTDTFGIGVGLGSVRSSSFALAVLSNIGVIGALFVGIFFCITFFRSYKDDDDYTKIVRSAARLACGGLLVAACISGTLVDLGLPFYIFAALACSKSVLEPIR